MVRDVLLINSDLAVNRGDRAIAEGNVQLIQRRFPRARVRIISQHPERDRRWYSTEVLDMDFQSLSPVDLVRLLRAARQADVVLWGGGEILKDYTNKAALWYWTLKMTAVSLANPRLFGAYQGIGPTSSPVSRRMIAFVVNRCRRFVVRDAESAQKAVAWGADPAKVVTAADPAVLPPAEPIDDDLRRRLREDFDIDDAFLEDFVCVGPRDWFHYRPGGLLPYKYAQALRRRGPRPEAADDERHATYLRHLTELVSELTKAPDAHVLLAPMHLSESDTDLCRTLAERSARPEAIRILDKDTLSPREFRSVIGQAKGMIGFRLHSNIIGVSAAVPCLNIYYVDKGRVFFDQIGQSRFARPIEDTLDEGFVADVLRQLDDILDHREEIRGEIRTATTELRRRVTEAFEEIFPHRDRTP